ncbi:hypothetical protein V2J09_004700 [Rumex salicifolius]
MRESEAFGGCADMATNARDARRRRILQGGQDRLNLITGRVQNISSTDSQSTIPDISVASDEAQSPPLVSQDLDPTPHYPPAGGKVQLLIFILFGVVFFVGFFYAAVVSKLLPPSTNPILSAIQKDRYYCFLVPLSLPVLVVFIYFHWLSMKLFRHA